MPEAVSSGGSLRLMAQNASQDNDTGEGGDTHKELEHITAVQSIDLHVLLAKVVGAVQAHSSDSDRQLKQLLRQNEKLTAQNEKQNEQIEKLTAQNEKQNNQIEKQHKQSDRQLKEIKTLIAQAETQNKQMEKQHKHIEKQHEQMTALSRQNQLLAQQVAWLMNNTQSLLKAQDAR